MKKAFQLNIVDGIDLVVLSLFFIKNLTRGFFICMSLPSSGISIPFRVIVPLIKNNKHAILLH